MSVGQKVKQHTKDEAGEWRRAAELLGSQYRRKNGVEVGPCNLLLHVRACEGLMRRLDGSVEKRFSQADVTYPLQVSQGNHDIRSTRQARVSQ